MPIVWVLIIYLQVGTETGEIVSDKKYITHGECQWVGEQIQAMLETDDVKIKWKCVELENYEDIPIRTIPNSIN